MTNEIEVNMYRSPIDTSTTYAVRINEIMVENTAIAVIRMIAERVADKYVAEHYAEIAAKLDQNAIANLAIADASKKIAEEIQRRPNIIHETKHHTEVYKRGLLGGLRRIG